MAFDYPSHVFMGGIDSFLNIKEPSSGILPRILFNLVGEFNGKAFKNFNAQFLPTLFVLIEKKSMTYCQVVQLN